MMVVWTSHTIVSATFTHCRHINELPRGPVLLSTASLSKNKLYKYQENKKNAMTYKYKACIQKVKKILQKNFWEM